MDLPGPAAGEPDDPGRQPGRRYLLSGLLRCPRCHRGLFGHRQEQRTFYQCRDDSPAKNAAGTVCNPRRYPAQEAEDTILRMLRQAARAPQRFPQALRAYEVATRRDGAGEELEGVKDELSRLEARERTVVQAQIAGMQAGASQEAYAAVFQEITAERAALQDWRAKPSA